ncbi:MAG: ketoacyl-ACP synthase III [Planctomycetaceae bacterium]|nr:ketoacyl-ACP synthase III [Planctomycetaceae bacterium]
MSRAQISAIEFHLPEQVLANDELADIYSGWTPEAIEQKLGVRTRRVAAPGETSSDLAAQAAAKLFARDPSLQERIDFVIFCTQEPDHFLPTTACLLQHRLGLSEACGAFDFNLGCSGFIYGLSLSRGLIETGQARTILLLTGNTYSKFINRKDRVSRPLFGDGASATLVEAVENPEDDGPLLGPFVFGTDGSGGDLLIVPAGAMRMPATPETAVEHTDSKGGTRSKNQLYMHGPGVFSFSVDRVPPLVQEVLDRAELQRDDIDLFVFHQANKFMLERLRKQCDIAPERFMIDMLDRGNTVASTIPIALVDAQASGLLKPRSRAMLVGFGVGLSWAATIAILPERL